MMERASKAAWWSAIEIAARFGVQVAVMVLLARLLSPSDFGLIAMVLVFTSMGALLADSGFGTALIQRQRTTDDDETTVFLFTTGTALLLASLLWLLAPAIATYFHQPRLAALIRVIVMVLPLGALAAVPDALLTMQLRFKERTKAELFASIASAVVALGLAWGNYGVWSLVWQAIVLIGMRALLLWVYSRWRPRGHFRMASFRSLSGFGIYMLMSGLLDTLTLRLQALLIGKLFDTAQLGYYTLAQNTQQAPTSFMGNLLNRVGLPVFSAVGDQPHKLLGALRLSMRLAMFIFVPSMLGLAVIARPLTLLLYGPKWTPAASLLSILALSAALWPLHVLNLAAVSAQGRSDLFFRLSLVKKTLAIGLILLGSLGGPVAIAGAVLAASVLSAVINAHYSKVLLGYGIAAQIADQRATFGLSLLAAATGWSVIHWLPASTMTTALAIFLAAALYLTMAAVTKNSALGELVTLLKNLRGGKAPTGAKKPTVSS
ncbi:lipopolysaccharide biosynthesis protein [Dyella sp.]|jgi:O-antigen/teichoic acid export membrane protein|uniref:lipopolysaccharide biosynthesis protein n=1 Tax=Dyella sp. TaxID=1869338 RepID=UPI002D7704DC|nr:lipopolysaccharide biosynthesis protein [Dyella sp.]HET6433211.1 lipopolysaccharide biosynthesis protein [Dyella sp.]